LCGPLETANAVFNLPPLGFELLDFLAMGRDDFQGDELGRFESSKDAGSGPQKRLLRKRSHRIRTTPAEPAHVFLS
jgi:hypothetical protein